MEKINSKDLGKKFLLELKDLLVGAAFPFMLSVILCTTVVSNFVYGGEDMGIKIVILLVGEVLIIAAKVIILNQTGTAA